MNAATKAYEKYPREFAPREGDSERMIAAIAVAIEVAGSFVRPTSYQLKVGRINYYPDKATILSDGSCNKLTGQAVEDFKRELVRMTRQP